MTFSRAAQALWAKKSRDGSLLWLPLITHLEDSAAIARKLWRRWISDGVRRQIITDVGEEYLAEQLLIFLASAHDIGKATPAFQSKNAMFPAGDLDERIKEMLVFAGLPMRDYDNSAKSPHAVASQLILSIEGCNKGIAAILGAHHGKPVDTQTWNIHSAGAFDENYFLDNDRNNRDNPWRTVQKELVDFALEMSGFSDPSYIPKLSMASQVIMCGLLIMTDWIASGERYFPYISIDETYASLNANARVKAAWDDLDLTEPWYPSAGLQGIDLFQKRFSFIPNSIQSAVAEIVCNIGKPGILVLEAAMGTGKTEAALAAAEIFAQRERRSGVFFALPSQATSDGIFPRMLKWIEVLDDKNHSLHLYHGKAEFNEKYRELDYGKTSCIYEDEENEGSVIVHEWFKGRKKAMLADFVVGTIDQLLLAALKQKHVMLRHLGLANKVVIIDECHAYDAYMNQYLETALRWLGAYNIPVIVLSATLPAKRRQSVVNAYLGIKYSAKPSFNPLDQSNTLPVSPHPWVNCRDYPLITYTDNGKIKQVSVKMKGDSRKVHISYLSDDAIVETLARLLSDGGCAGVIVNTVKRAQDLTVLLRMHFGDDVVRLMHSRFLAPDRAKKEKELLEELGKPRACIRPALRIVVGTQVLEQSLDIDFDVLITDICPMDLLLQRIGRLQRHERLRPVPLKEPLCLITGLNGEGFDSGTSKIYGDYLLLRTKSFLPEVVTIPDSIADLVQNVYDDEMNVCDGSPEYIEAKIKWEKIVEKKEKRAGDFRINHPQPGDSKCLINWLATALSEKQGEASVRDSDESIEVLMVMEKGGRIYLMPWSEDFDKDGYGMYEVPDNRTAVVLAKQSVRLPAAICAPWMIEKVLNDLEDQNKILAEWQKSTWLKGALFLILDETGSVNVCEYRLTYDKDMGLIHEKVADSQI